ncbi:hypothetical protein MXB_2132 [Myxobolus squamalis]|nr:hypothetical protein MXB_2132 [Myxobolus squamalis]
MLFLHPIYITLRELEVQEDYAELTVNILTVDAMAKYASRSSDEMSAELFSQFKESFHAPWKFSNTIKVSEKFTTRPIYSYDIFVQTVKNGGSMIESHIDLITGDEIQYLQYLADIWTHFYGAIIPKFELIFRNLVDCRISKSLLLQMRSVLNNSARLSDVILKIGILKNNPDVKTDIIQKLNQMFLLLIGASREEALPLTSEGIRLYSIYQSLFGPDPYLST